MPRSPAAKAGIKERDVITAVDDKPIEDFSDLAQAIGLRAPGDKVTISLIRDGDKQQVKATLADAANTAGANGAGPGNELAKGLQGATFGALTDDNPMSQPGQKRCRGDRRRARQPGRARRACGQTTSSRRSTSSR